jgi:hypothetical protein
MLFKENLRYECNLCTKIFILTQDIAIRTNAASGRA